MNNNLNILVQSTDFYCPFCGVMLESLFYNNTDIDLIKVYIISDGIEKANLNKLQELAEKYKRKIEILDGKKKSEELKEMGCIEWHGSCTLYLKLFALNYITDDIDRLLYLDCDMIVNGSLKGLIDVDLKDNVVGMVGGTLIPETSDLKLHNKVLCNGGLILFDVKKWKEINGSQMISDYLCNVRAKFQSVDEELLQVVMNGKVYLLDLKYNIATTLIEFNKKGGKSLCEMAVNQKFIYTNEEWNDGFNNTIIFHYLSGFYKRPWYEKSDDPAADIWDKYFKMSPWKNIKKIKDDRSFPFKAQRFLRVILPKRLFAVVNIIALKIIKAYKNHRYKKER